MESVISLNRSPNQHPECKNLTYCTCTINTKYYICIDADKLGELGPSLGMKKSSSLESLQTMVQEVKYMPLNLLQND